MTIKLFSRDPKGSATADLRSFYNKKTGVYASQERNRDFSIDQILALGTAAPREGGVSPSPRELRGEGRNAFLKHSGIERAGEHLHL